MTQIQTIKATDPEAFDAAVRRQLWEVEDQLWRDSLPDWQRQAIVRGRQHWVEIHREARRRLGLPEEEPRG